MVRHLSRRARSAIALVVLFDVACAYAQVHSDPVHTDSRPLADVSANVGAGSQPVHESGRSVRDGSLGGLGGLGGNSVRDSVSGDVRSGPVSDVSAGPVTSWRPVSGGGTMTDASVGSVGSDTRAGIAEQALQPVRDLGPLVEQLRAIQPLPDDGTLPEAQPEAGQGEEAEIAPEDQDTAEAGEPAVEEEPATEASEASEPDGVAADAEPAAPADQPPDVAADAEGESPPGNAGPSAADDPRDAAEPTPARN